MPITIGSNISSLMAQRSFADATNEVATSQERLASGMRINRASDDVAGLAIAEQLNVDQVVLSQGIRNLNEGISVLNITDAAIAELSSITSRLQELAEQSANGVYSSEQRAVLNQEAQALKAEFSRIRESTEYNDKLLFMGEGELDLQAGYSSIDASISGEAGTGGAVGDGTFQERVSYDGADGSFSSMRLADLDGDGNLDAVGTDIDDHWLNVFMGNGDGTFEDRVEYATGRANHVYLADVNNDGDLDALTANFTNSNVGVSLGDGEGGFEATTYVGTGYWNHSVAAADLNNDGNVDLITTIMYDDTTEIRFGNGNGTFGAAMTYSQSLSRGREISVSDFNNDGYLDLAIVCDNDIEIRLNDQSGGFSNTTVYDPTATNITSMAIGDYDGDGYEDLAVLGNGATDAVTIYLGSNDGSFTKGADYMVTDGREIRTGDLNGDGILDLAVADYDEAVVIFSGSGNGTFSAAQTLDSGTTTRTLGIGDFNNDGVPDIVAGSAGDNTFNVFIANAIEGGVANTIGEISNLSSFSLTTESGSLSALSQFNNKLDSLSSQRGKVGAVLARINIAEEVLQISNENYAVAEGRIRDADIAQEAANLVRTQILQQGAAAILAQANQQPSLALTLLS